MSETPQSPAASPQPGVKPMDAIMALCKRRGFIYQASEIYGGINGFWDYGPMGAQLKKNLRDAWWQDVVMLPAWGRKGPTGERVEMVPLDTTIIQHPKVWQASGHVEGFNDPMVDDKETKQRFRADHLQGLHLAFQSDAIPADQLLQAFARKYATEGAAQLADAGDLIPRATIVANNEQDALRQLADNRKLQKELGIEVLAQDELPHGPKAVALVRWQRSPVVLVVKPVPMTLLKEHPEKVPSPFTRHPGHLTEPKQFNLMFFTYTCAVFDEDNKVYLRPETAQGIFVQFKNVVDTTRVKIPFGIAQTGKAFRNEVTPRNFTFRSREFEQMEIEFFCHESEAMQWYAFWRDWRMEWWKSIGLAGDNLILREHEKDELAHYAKATSDIEYRFPFTAPGFGELEGVAYRGDFDLAQHQKHSGAKLEYFDTDRGETLPNGSKRGERYLPHVIEPSAGLDRGVLAVLCEAYTRDDSRASPEFMKFHPRIAPIKAAVFPLVNKDGMPDVADRLHEDLVRRFARIGAIETDAKQTIGKRYARMDEAGCPFCFTVDGDGLKDNTVTVRHRDTGAQERIATDRAGEWLHGKLAL